MSEEYKSKGEVDNIEMVSTPAEKRKQLRGNKDDENKLTT